MIARGPLPLLAERVRLDARETVRAAFAPSRHQCRDGFRRQALIGFMQRIGEGVRRFQHRIDRVRSGQRQRAGPHRRTAVVLGGGERPKRARRGPSMQARSPPALPARGQARANMRSSRSPSRRCRRCRSLRASSGSPCRRAIPRRFAAERGLTLQPSRMPADPPSYESSSLPPHELGPSSNSTLSTSSLAVLRKRAMSSSAIGSGLKSPHDLTSGDQGTPSLTGYSLFASA